MGSIRERAAAARSGQRPAATSWLPMICMCIMGLHGSAHAGNSLAELWILVDTGEHTLSVFRGEQVLHRFDDVAIGRGGASADRERGDGSTPLGTFHIDRIHASSRFLLFFGIDFPRPEHARRAFDAGRIDAEDYERILAAYEANRPPPQDTPLGGQLGIHGLGPSDQRVHEAFNWTQGCIALTNAQIKRLSRWIHLGMRVDVR
jgi:murein L,D-transpeptidase YafK